jgi:hypothetical protein
MLILVSVYTIPGDLFQVPTGYVWIFTARLVTGKGLPPMAKEFAIGFAVLYAVLTTLRIYATDSRWKALIPGGIAVAVGKLRSLNESPTADYFDRSLTSTQACTMFPPSP